MADDPDVKATDEDRAGGATALERARRARDRLLARATFWDQWRATLTLPLIVVGAAAGYLAGLGLRALGMPPKTEMFAAVVGILLAGRFVGAYFDVRKLVAAERRLAALRERVDLPREDRGPRG